MVTDRVKKQSIPDRHSHKTPIVLNSPSNGTYKNEPGQISWLPPGLEIRENLEKWEGIFQSGKSQGILLRLEKSGNFTQNTGKIEKKTGKVREICQLVIVKTLQIWYHTSNKKNNVKNTGKLQKNTGKVREICQSEKVGTM